MGTHRATYLLRGGMSVCRVDHCFGRCWGGGGCGNRVGSLHSRLSPESAITLAYRSPASTSARSRNRRNNQLLSVQCPSPYYQIQYQYPWYFFG